MSNTHFASDYLLKNKKKKKNKWFINNLQQTNQFLYIVTCYYCTNCNLFCRIMEKHDDAIIFLMGVTLMLCSCRRLLEHVLQGIILNVIKIL
jgi:hypothetical protein